MSVRTNHKSRIKSPEIQNVSIGTVRTLRFHFGSLFVLILMIGCQKTTPLEFNDRVDIRTAECQKRPASCPKSPQPDQDDPSPSPSPSPSPFPGDGSEGPMTFAKVSKVILEPNNCLFCHSGEFPEDDLDLSTEENVLLAPGLVVPGQPEESALYLSVKSGRMPKNAPPLKPHEIEMIADWIRTLAESPTP